MSSRPKLAYSRALLKISGESFAGGRASGIDFGVIERLSDYHAVVRAPDGAPRPGLGEQVAIVPNHICPVVYLFDSFLAVGAGGPGAPPEILPVDARGRNR